ncbi:tripartite ATP-independent transporter solute receptor, DctP family [Sphaerochaeta associata]|uniref:TRAP transporter substrate-binding protein n=1 Tax=Sphaerochaeta associata TaxID=1129264 RepID=A0ABY4D9S5_9SPIR|nr:TRAP transporter substrate-binding protein [Sphaerochaeta associata]UOM51032.1 TRAP transporter substrate-binding protein [Sphaerochaeta associata]SMP56956.1 tripartite ATP-independent transporter solute receptor, DctP family [Sphaerochaeta associata]
MKKTIIVLICGMLMLAQGLFAGGAAEANTTQKVSKGKFNIDVPVDHPKAVAFQSFADELRTETDGRVDITIFPSSQLGGELETAEGIKLNSIQLGSITTSVLTSWIPELQILDMPFLFTEDEEATNGTTWLAGYLQDKFEKQGFHLIGFSINGARNPMSSFPIYTPDDVKGKKIRVIQSPIHLALWKSVGSTPVSIPANEIFTSMQTKVVDFFDNTPTNYWSWKFYEAAPYYSELNHIYAVAAWVCSKDWYDGLSADDQKTISNLTGKTISYIHTELRKQDVSALQKAADNGATIIRNIDKTPWIEKMKPVWDQFGASIPNSQEMFDGLLGK